MIGFATIVLLLVGLAIYLWWNAREHEREQLALEKQREADRLRRLEHEASRSKVAPIRKIPKAVPPPTNNFPKPVVSNRVRRSPVVASVPSPAPAPTPASRDDDFGRDLLMIGAGALLHHALSDDKPAEQSCRVESPAPAPFESGGGDFGGGGASGSWEDDRPSDSSSSSSSYDSGSSSSDSGSSSYD